MNHIPLVERTQPLVPIGEPATRTGIPTIGQVRDFFAFFEEAGATPNERSLASAGYGLVEVLQSYWAEREANTVETQEASA